MYKSACPISAD